MGALGKLGFVNFYQDEVTMLLSAMTSRGWLRTRRPRDDKDHILQEVGKVFGALGKGVLHVMQADSTR